jgi:hypothetical protein
MFVPSVAAMAIVIVNRRRAMMDALFPVFSSVRLIGS